MKKSIFSLLIASAVAYTSAASDTCLDFSANLSRGSESAVVLQLQNFLAAKGFLKVVPNGYFGPSTLVAVKAYQKSKGFAQPGNTGPMTRAAIKKDSCAAPANNQASASLLNSGVQNSQTTAQNPVMPQTPRPMIDSFDLVTLFAGGETEWTFNMYGSNFSTSTNMVYFKNVSNGRTYAMGAFSSATGTIIIFPKNLTNTVYSCGIYCSEKLPTGRYEVTVATGGGQSEPKILDIKPFTITAQTAASQGALPSSGTNIKFGSLSFSTSLPVIVRSVAMMTGSSTISDGGIGTAFLKDEITGQAVANDALLPEFQSMIVSAYVTTSNVIPGNIQASFVIEIEDYIGKKRTKFVSPSFMATVAGVL